MAKQERYLRRAEAARHVREKHNQRCSTRYLANLASRGGDGPLFMMNGRYPFYPISGLDQWAMAKKSPLVQSVAEARRHIKKS